MPSDFNPLALVERDASMVIPLWGTG